MIKEELQNGTDEEKDAMLQAGEEALAQYTQKEFSSLIQPLKEVDLGLFSDAHKERLARIITKLRAILLIASSDCSNISIQQFRGLNLVHESDSGDTDVLSPNGVNSWQITLS